MNPIVPMGLTTIYLYSTGHWIGATVVLAWLAWSAWET